MQKILKAGLKLQQGFCDPLIIAVVVGCFAVGSLYMAFSKKVDAPVEQAAEAVLRAEGIDVDFSAGKKDVYGNQVAT